MSTVTITAEDIEREHRDALASLTPAQRRALERVRVARQHCRFNGRYVNENLQSLFEAEAGERTAAAAMAPAVVEERERLAKAVRKGFPIAA